MTFFSTHRGVLLIPDSTDIFLNSATAAPVNSNCAAFSPFLGSFRQRIADVQKLPVEKHHFKGAQNLMSIAGTIKVNYRLFHVP